MRRFVCLTATFALAAGLSQAADETHLLSPRLAPGQVIAYDGTYRLQVPSGKNGKSLILASLAYGLVFKVEEVEPRGAALSLEYDRFEWRLRGSSAVPPAMGRVFKFRLGPQGQVAEILDPSLSWLREVWPGWPSRPLRVGESWRVVDKAATTNGSLKAASREFRLCEVSPKGGKNLAFLDYIERGQVAPLTVNLPDGQGRLEGAILGVGQISLDLACGLVENAAAIGVLDGTLRPAAGNGGAKPVRLEIETTIRLRQGVGS